MVQLVFKEKHKNKVQVDSSNETKTKLLLQPKLHLMHLVEVEKWIGLTTKMSTVSTLLCGRNEMHSQVKSSNNKSNNSNNNNNTASTTTNTNSTLKRRININRLSMTFILSLALIISCLTITSAFQLDGSQSSFAQFRKWYVGLNGSLELEFKTEQPNGLVLYTDDGGTYDFFELKLVEGALRLRYNLGGGAQIITVGRDLHDGHWHKVQVSVFCIILMCGMKEFVLWSH